MLRPRGGRVSGSPPPRARRTIAAGTPGAPTPDAQTRGPPGPAEQWRRGRARPFPDPGFAPERGRNGADEWRESPGDDGYFDVGLSTTRGSAGVGTARRHGAGPSAGKRRASRAVSAPWRAFIISLGRGVREFSRLPFKVEGGAIRSFPLRSPTSESL